MNIIAIAAWLAGLVGFGLLVGGVALIHVPTAFIIAGLGLIGWAWLADKAAARAQFKRNPEGG
ncbi:hypothetical protein CYD26_21090 [Pseudomonas sp. FFUP_PS_473]|uniref:Uncharacterized protein n=1 Tax=Pseudomonas laurentiana TaxID=2364649 RepID=A0A6I5RQJ7_9PSED|nr:MULTISPECIES: hypothetical protein [Pseudomonas]NES09728.1 hypothetical protein [Pseudomonas laurentiana]PLP87623.1 hypothetical protein CYD26_21090 [Pseudomonas sp. FFUP_PS_473]GGU53887.1 hypothetical protein GCM10009504_08440 [Pseudomonas laurentiana]